MGLPTKRVTFFISCQRRNIPFFIPLTTQMTTTLCRPGLSPTSQRWIHSPLPTAPLSTARMSGLYLNLTTARTYSIFPEPIVSIHTYLFKHTHLYWKTKHFRTEQNAPVPKAKGLNIEECQNFVYDRARSQTRPARPIRPGQGGLSSWSLWSPLT